MKLLMTGATGLIGREVGKKLIEAGHTICVLSRRPEEARRELPFPAELFAWHGESEPVPADAIRGVQAVIHLVGEPIAGGRWTEKRKARIRDSRVLGTQRIVEAFINDPAALAQLKVFVHGSAIGIYGERGEETLS